jgi:hypothetical protein
MRVVCEAVGVAEDCAGLMTVIRTPCTLARHLEMDQVAGWLAGVQEDGVSWFGPNLTHIHSLTHLSTQLHQRAGWPIYWYCHLPWDISIDR